MRSSYRRFGRRAEAALFPFGFDSPTRHSNARRASSPPMPTPVPCSSSRTTTRVNSKASTHRRYVARPEVPDTSSTYRLAGWARVELEPGKSRRVRIRRRAAQLRLLRPGRPRGRPPTSLSLDGKPSCVVHSRRWCGQEQAGTAWVGAQRRQRHSGAQTASARREPVLGRGPPGASTSGGTGPPRNRPPSHPKDAQRGPTRRSGSSSRASRSQSPCTAAAS